MIIIDEDFKAQVNYYKQEIDNLPKYKNEKKNKLSYEWEMAKRKYEILKIYSSRLIILIKHLLIL